MTSEEFREDLREVVQRHNPDAETLRDLSERLDNLADYREQQDEML